MSKADSIRQVLHKSLFASPTCKNKQEYRHLYSDIFPNDELFIRFLDTTNHEERVDCSKKIVHRLLYDLKLLIPPSLVDAILMLEKDIEHLTVEGHISRDHYEHLVFSYIQSIYLFFYNDVFRNEIQTGLTRLRRESSVTSIYELDVLSDAIFLIKCFCLTHDIGYVWEEFSKNQTVGVNWPDYIGLFENNCNHLSQELSFRLMSRVVALYYLISSKGKRKLNESLKNIKSVSKNYLVQNGNGTVQKITDDNIQFAINKFGDAVSIPRLNSSFGIQLVRTLFGNEKTIAVLEEYKQSICVVYSLDDQANSYHVFLHNSLSGKKLNNKEWGHYAFEERKTFRKSQQWRYYILSPTETLQNGLGEILGPHFVDFESFAESILGSISPQLLWSLDDRDFKEFCFEIYVQIKEMIKPNILTDSSGIMPELREVYTDNAQTLFSGEIGKELNIFIKETRDTDSDLGRILFDMPEDSNPVELIRHFLVKARKSLKEKEISIAESIANKIGKQIKKIKAAYAIFEYLNNAYQQKITCHSLFNDNKIDLYLVADLGKHVFEDLEDVISLTSKEIIYYKPNIPAFTRIDPYYDHGVAGFACLLMIQDFLKELIKLDVRSHSPLKPLSLILDIGTDLEWDRFKFQIEHLSDVLLRAVLLHNLDLSQLTSMRIRLDTEPFSYFAILNDELQNWERKRNANLAKVNIQPGYYLDNCQIRSTRNAIHICFKKGFPDMESELQSIRVALDKKLFKARDFIKPL